MKLQAFSHITIILALLSGCDSNAPLPVNQEQASVKTVAVGNIKLGLKLADPCAACHGPTGAAIKNGAPYLAGQHADYLAATLGAYQSGQRKHAAMQKTILNYNQADILNVSTYYAKQTANWRGANGSYMKPTQRAALSRGELAKKACVGCHGINGNSDNSAVPSLAGLQPEYFITAFENYFADRRKGTVMKHFKQSVNWRTLQDLAVYYSTQKRLKKSFPLPGNPVKGKKLAHLCHGCHGIKGSTLLSNMPDLANQNVKYLLNAIKSYTNGKRQNALMKEATRELSNAQIRNLASYYAQITLTPGSKQGDNIFNVFDPVKQGSRLAENCQGCHGENGNSVTAGTPSISALSINYFKKSFNDYGTGHREHRMMPLFAKATNDSQKEKLALYYEQADISTRKPYTSKLSVANEFLIDCNACHGDRGHSVKATTPSLAGQDVDYLRNALHAYKTEIRQHSGMQNATKDLNSENINQLADYYASQQAQAPTATVLTPPQDLGKKCDRCHGPYGKSVTTTVPILAGQSEHYLVTALLEYKNRIRSDSMMYAMAEILTLSEIEAIARHYSNQ